MKKKSLILILALGILSLVGCGEETVNDQPDTVLEETANDDLEKQEESDKQELPETGKEDQEKVVYPLPTTIDLNDLKDCTLAVSVENGAISSDETDAEKWKMNVTVYDQELYDLIDISALAVGNNIEIGGDLVQVASIETNELGTVIINGGLDVGGYELVTNEDGVYYSIGYSDVKNYDVIGDVELSLSSAFVYKDESDLDAGVKEYTISELMENTEAVEYGGTPHNTTIVIEDGMVTSMTKVYMP